MLGLWSTSVHLLGNSFDSFALGSIVLDIIFFVAIIYAWVRLPEQPDSPKRKSVGDSFRKIIIGTNILLLWYAMTIIDLFLHEGRVRVTYGYIIVNFVLAVLKFNSDILMIANTHRLVSALLYKIKKHRVWFLAGEFLTIILILMALYYLGSLFANEVLWLLIAESGVISGIATRRDQFETAFFIIQFVFALLILIGSTINFAFWSEDEGRIPKHVAAAVGAAGMLWVRSLSELIVIRIQIQNPTMRGTTIARNTIYGLATFFFLLLIDAMAREMSNYDTRNPLQAKIDEDTRRYVIGIVGAAVAAGEKPPPLAPIFQAMRQDPVRTLSDQTKRSITELNDDDEKAALGQHHQDYIIRLETRYGHMESVDRSREY